MSELISVIKGPEFWMTVAFFAVIFLSAKPLSRYLRTWGQKRADGIQSRLDEAINLSKKAENLLSEYEQKTKNKENEKQSILAKAEQDAEFLKADLQKKLSERLTKQDEDTEFRLKLMKEQGRRDVQDKILRSIMMHTRQLLVKKASDTAQTSAQMDAAVDNICAVLDEQTDLIRKI